MSESILQLLHRARQLVHASFMSSTNATLGKLTPTQFLLLRTIASHPGTSQTALVNAIGTDRSTIADVVKRLLESRLIRRQKHKIDSRAYVIHLTDEGREALDIAENAASMFEANLRAGLGEKDFEQLLMSLQSLIGELEASQGGC